MLRRVLFTGCLLAALLGAMPLAAQENTPEPTGEPTAEMTVEATSEATPEATAESTLPPGMYIDFPGPGSYTVRQTDQTPERTYRVYIPESYTDEGDPLPMVIVMHGAGGNGAGTELFTGFNDLAEQENFVVVYPNGINNVWNDGRVGDSRVSGVDDVRFLDSVVQFMEQLAQRRPAARLCRRLFDGRHDGVSSRLRAAQPLRGGRFGRLDHADLPDRRLQRHHADPGDRLSWYGRSRRPLDGHPE